MAQIRNLARLLNGQLPAPIVEFMQEAGLAAAGRGERLFLAGGAVRDLLLNRPNTDIDLVVMGDAIGLAKQMASLVPGRLVTHTRFQTAKLTLADWSADFAIARHETYDSPGALPQVKPGTINVDLYRRDFTINAMAVELSPRGWGDLLDPCGGLGDLENRLIRILHDDSFIDDATRIWRALRYEQRLGFNLERHTLNLLKKHSQMLETISADRLRRELELILEENYPEKTLRRAEKLETLKWFYPLLKGDAWLTRKFRQARAVWSTFSEPPFGGKKVPAEIYLALLAYRLSNDEIRKFESGLNLRKNFSKLLDDSARLRALIDILNEESLRSSAIYDILAEFHPFAIAVNLSASEAATAKRNMRLFLTELCHIRPSLTGNDLLRMGIRQGPEMKDMLHILSAAKMDAKVSNKDEEIILLQKHLSQTVDTPDNATRPQDLA